MGGRSVHSAQYMTTAFKVPTMPAKYAWLAGAMDEIVNGDADEDVKRVG
jgi:hypothetical protein